MYLDLRPTGLWLDERERPISPWLISSAHCVLWMSSRRFVMWAASLLYVGQFSCMHFDLIIPKELQGLYSRTLDIRVQYAPIWLESRLASLAKPARR
jgi:hypothetical protein